MNRTNVIATPSTPLRKKARFNRRYSNLQPGNYSIGGSFESYGGKAGLTGGLTGGNSSSGTSGSGTFDFYGFFNNLLDSGTTIVTSIWGKDNKWQVEGLNAQLEAERKTNTILWVVIGLVLALIIFLVVRKTK